MRPGKFFLFQIQGFFFQYFVLFIFLLEDSNGMRGAVAYPDLPVSAPERVFFKHDTLFAQCMALDHQKNT